MRYGDLLNTLESRARRVGLPVDAPELELAMYFQLQKLADTYDIDALVVDNPSMAITSSGVEAYQLPEDFGRLLHPFSAQNQNTESGLRLFVSATSIKDLTYERAQAFTKRDRSTTGTPDTFTMIGTEILLNPVPNSNDSANYTLQGTYVHDVGMPDLDDMVPIEEPSFLVTAALYQVSADTPGVDANTLQLLQREMNAQLSSIVNNQARRRQAMYQSSERPGRSYR